MKTLMVIILSVLSFVSKAGEVEIVSDYWDNICKVQIVAGKDAPEQGFTTNLTNVQKGFSTIRNDRACYRRSNDPDNCDSGLTVWTCQNQTISGKSTLDIR